LIGLTVEEFDGPDEESSAIDLQAAHTSRMTGACCALVVREGHGHVASSWAEFRALSRDWHTCLGLGVTLPPRDESSHEADAVALHRASAGQLAGHKRTLEGLEIELNNWPRLESVMQTKKKRVGRGRPAVKVCMIE
jgi:hypothetical protein